MATILCVIHPFNLFFYFLFRSLTSSTAPVDFILSCASCSAPPHPVLTFDLKMLLLYIYLEDCKRVKTIKHGECEKERYCNMRSEKKLQFMHACMLFIALYMASIKQ